MTLTTKDSADPASSSKPAAQAPNPENKSAQTPRSNPVCLELGVTIRSLPTESGGAFQPIREEGRTVIVFDNGAVLRCASNLPVGQTVILSNPSGRDVICRIVGARNMPSIKGYVEVEFIEPVEDFWHIHQPIEPAVVVSHSQATSEPPEAESVAPAGPAVAGLETPPRTAPDKPTIVPTGAGPSFEDIAGLVSPPNRTTQRELRVEPANPARELRTKNEPARTHAETSGSASPFAAKLPDSEPRNGNLEVLAAEESESTPSPDFMGEGLLASPEASSSSSSGLSGRMPFRIGGAALLLAAIGGGMYFMQRGSAPAPAARVTAATQSSVTEPPGSVKNKEPEPALAAQAPAKQDAPRAGQTQPAVIGHAEPAASIAPTPATVSSRVAKDLPSEERPDKSTQDKSANAAKTSEAASAHSQAIPNLKMKSPSAPKRGFAGQSDVAAPAAEIAAPESATGTSSAGLLSAVARSANQPAPPSVTPAELATRNRDAKLISSAQAVYPQAAKVANIQGSVSVLVSIDSNGNVVDAKAEGGPMLLRQAALESVRRWKYSPALVDGKPAAANVIVSVEFKLH
jgi:TonB family protein